MQKKKKYPKIPLTVQERVKEVLFSSKRLLILGIGEVRMSDDGFGPYIAYSIRDLKKKNMLIINGKTDYIERKQEILNFNPDNILILDTCNSSDVPGTIIFAEENKLVDWIPISSHVIPIQVFIMELRLDLPKMKSYLLGINPVYVESPPELFPFMPEKYTLDDFDENPDLPFYKITLTDEIKEGADQIVTFLEDIINSMKNG
jgi:hydrogenase maturation protease